jgi:glycine cleavage system H protein
MSLYFTRDHEWIRVEGDTATVGISDHAQAALGDIVFAEVPEPGKTLAKGDEAAVVESVKAASDIYAPVGGEVIEGNAALGDDRRSSIATRKARAGSSNSSWRTRARSTG